MQHASATPEVVPLPALAAGSHCLRLWLPSACRASSPCRSCFPCRARRLPELCHERSQVDSCAEVLALAAQHNLHRGAGRGGAAAQGVAGAYERKQPARRFVSPP